MKAQREAWPPYCCVPAFVDAVLRQFGVESPSPQILAQTLGVTVPDGIANPWALPLASSEVQAGLTPSKARSSINRLLVRWAPQLRMRHVPFSAIAFELYADVAGQALQRHVAVGIGLDWGALQGDGRSVHRHLLRLLDANALSARLYDDSLSAKAVAFDVAWDDLEHSVQAVQDGLWLIGPVSALHFDATVPWSESEAP